VKNNEQTRLVQQALNQNILFYEKIEYKNWLTCVASKWSPIEFDLLKRFDKTTKAKNLSEPLLKRIFVFLKELQFQKDAKDLMWDYRLYEAISEFQMEGKICKGKLKNILQDPINSCLFKGFHCFLIDNNIPYDSIAGLNYLKWLPKLILNKIVRLAEACGVMPLFNPEEHTRNRCAEFWDQAVINKILNKIELELKIPLEFPNPFINEYGIQTAKGLISARPCDAIYQAFRLNGLNNLFGFKKIIEIGGGLGRTAYYAHKFGIKDYTIVDLPHVVVAQALFIGQTLGEERLCLPNEAKMQEFKNGIKLITPDIFFSNKEKYDLCLNADSFVEMDFEVAKNYLDKLKTSCSGLLSINQEAYKFRLLDCLKLPDLMIKILRYPYWMRKGYVEDLLLFKS